MEAIPFCTRTTTAPERVLVMGESRRSSLPSCSTCGSRRKTWLRSLGWVCTACFDQCKEIAEQCLEVGSGVTRLRHAYEQAILSYHAAHPTPVPEG